MLLQRLGFVPGRRKQVKLRGRIANYTIRADRRRLIEYGSLHLSSVHDVQDILARSNEIVSYDAPMAAPPYSFRAHY